MRRIWLAVSWFACCVAPALAADDIMAGYYGNTVIVTSGIADSHTHYRSDHTFDISATAMFMHYAFKGTWMINDKGEICLAFADPAPPRTSNPYCRPAFAHKAGDVWTVTRNGSNRTMTMKAGIE